jgi:hypothetical protein
MSPAPGIMQRSVVGSAPPSRSRSWATGPSSCPQFTATLLRDGRVLIAGGDEAGKAELYDPKSGTFGEAASMVQPTAGHTATLLADGRVLVVGGTKSFNGGPALYGPALPAVTRIVSRDGSLLRQLVLEELQGDDWAVAPCCCTIVRGTRVANRLGEDRGRLQLGRGGQNSG